MDRRSRISELGRIDVSDLLRMLAIAEHGSINRSAVALSTTQPTLTRRIKRLEASLGRDILQRSSAGVSLTPFGHHVVEHGKTIEHALAEILRLAQIRPVEEVRLGATHSCAGIIIPRAIRAFSAPQKNIRVAAVEGTREALVSELQEGALDVVIASPDVSPKEERALIFKPLFWVKLGIVARREHVLASGRGAGIAELRHAKWVLLGGDGAFTRRVELELGRLGIEIPLNTPLLPSHSSVLQFLCENDAVTLLPTDILTHDFFAKQFVVVNGEWSFSRFPCGAYVVAEAERDDLVWRTVKIIERVVDELQLPRISL